jgi:hypothetical protein
VDDTLRTRYVTLVPDTVRLSVGLLQQRHQGVKTPVSRACPRLSPHPPSQTILASRIG